MREKRNQLLEKLEEELPDETGEEWKAIQNELELDESVQMIAGYCNGLAGRLGLLITNATGLSNQEMATAALLIYEHGFEARVVPQEGSDLFDISNGDSLTVEADELTGYVARRTRASSEEVRTFLEQLLPVLDKFENCLPGLDISDASDEQFVISRRDYDEPEVRELER